MDVEACCASTKTLNIDYLYLDLQVCDRCRSTDQNLEEALGLLRPVLQRLGYSLKLRKCHISTRALAIQYCFLSSPTLRINNIDLFETITENECGCCSEISGHATNCRSFEEEGQSVNVPSVKLLIERILIHILTKPEINTVKPYVMPENLERFYQKKP